ncbi:fascin domain-containing protein [Chitinimonas lacunae]|uniref:ESPR domain-containing protein n=1 Tax=Chitinimonas lacunae TaxID=1963018 RepID=A0ABV8ML35_9NEIS
MARQGSLLPKNKKKESGNSRGKLPGNQCLRRGKTAMNSLSKLALRLAVGATLACTAIAAQAQDLAAANVAPQDCVQPVAQGVYSLRAGHGYLTAVNGGGMAGPANVPIAIRTDATSIGPNERFRLIMLSGNNIALMTASGNYVTAVNNGGIGEAANRLPLHTDAGVVKGWEIFSLNRL